MQFDDHCVPRIGRNGEAAKDAMWGGATHGKRGKGGCVEHRQKNHAKGKKKRP